MNLELERTLRRSLFIAVAHTGSQVKPFRCRPGQAAECRVGFRFCVPPFIKDVSGQIYPELEGYRIGDKHVIIEVVQPEDAVDPVRVPVYLKLLAEMHTGIDVGGRPAGIVRTVIL